ncbi:armadillo-type protein [Epithele typhae]|uniref:armadillo-type protein n=1 Tax=Epithele typhae TaxID=378194 RepID=UPI002007E8F4|nr:armadillo-type protein [Epithele typhae]KAH9925892.1 armadillo-type protein [Epithele typhae]
MPFDDLYEHLKPSLVSHSRQLRLQTLRLLILAGSASPCIAEFMQKALQAEEVSIDVQGARERVLRISRLPVAVKEGDEVTAGICARWLIGMSISYLKVNLKPLWAPAVAALATLANRFGDIVWTLLFSELQAASSASAEAPPVWLKERTEEEDDVWETERSWRDPNAHKVRISITRWLCHDAASRAMVKSQLTGDRFDVSMYEQQLLSALEACSSLAEKHNRDLVPHFLSLVDLDAPSKLHRPKLSAWLKLFSKFANPNALRSTDTLRALYVKYLSHPDRALQRLVLSCLFTYKSPRLAPHEDTLRTLLDDTKWRDELVLLDFTKFDQEERAEFVDTVIRLLFGMMIDRRGKRGGADRRAAILSTLAGCSDEELALLVDLMLEPFHGGRPVHEGGFTMVPVPEDVSTKQQAGFLTLLGDVLKQLGSRLVGCWPTLLETLLDLTGGAQTKISAQKADDIEEEAEAEDDEEVEVLDSAKALRNIRQLGLKRLAGFFRCAVVFDFSPYMREAFRTFISPRLHLLDQENTQSPSSLLDLFHAWSQRLEYAVYLTQYDDNTLPKVYDCLVATNVKPVVISKVFDIVEQLQSLSGADDNIHEHVFKPHVSHLLTNLSTLVSRSKGNVDAMTDVLGRRQITILSELAPYLSDSSQATMLIDLFAPLLRKPHKTLPEKIKVDMTRILCNLFPLIPDLADANSVAFTKAYRLLAQLFQTLRSRQARLALVSAFQVIAKIQPSIQTLSDLMASLNAYSTKRLEEPDFDRRMAAFAELNDHLHKSLVHHDWLPIIYNMLSFIQDPAELAIRSSAATSLKHFVDLVADEHDPYEETFLKILLPGIKNGLRSKAELVRSELLIVLSHAVVRCTSILSLQEMRVLLAGGDEEANFFNNVHHIQIHRRTRAVRRLAEFAEQGHLKSSTLADWFVPLIGNYIVSTDSLDHHLVNEAILTMGHMAKQLNWSAYYALVQRYLKLAKQKDASERVYVRTIVAILDAFHFPMEEAVPREVAVFAPEENVDEEEGEQEEAQPEPQPTHDLAKLARIQDAVNGRLLPSLISYLEKRDETEDSLRIPVATGIIQIAKHLPQDLREAQISRLLTVLSQVLKSKSQETRDLARETLCRIARVLGPDYLSLMIREMRGALLRGPHLHVLAYSVHALLVHLTSGDHVSTFHTLDSCVADVAAVSSEVIFGESGKDVQAEGFKTKMREVRGSSSRGVDSFALVAKYITPTKISALLHPIRNVMSETETLKIMQQIEELLKRIAGGLNSNAHLVPSELLVLCHTLINQNAKFLKEAPKHQPRGKGKRKDDALVQTKRQVTMDQDHYANNSFRFVAFGLDLFNTAHRRGRFDFKDPVIISRLEPMVAVIGNTLYSSHMQVVSPGLRAAAAIVKCPVKSIDKSLPVFIRQIIDVIKQAGSTEPEAVQTAFKALATILRDHPSAQVKEKDLVYLLELLGPDLEEPGRQAAVFTMLRAIIARRFVVPEIYDIMDKVAEIMVTNQSPSVQELCRGALLQFLLDYPQGKGRLRNQMTFLVKNLSYVYESGKLSVMELLSAMIAKFETSLVQEYADLLFLGLVMVIANDDSAKCREVATELIKGLLARMEVKQRNVVVSHVHTWAVQHSQAQLTRVSAQMYSLIVDFLKTDAVPYIPSICADMNAVLRRCADALEDAAAGEDDDEDSDLSQQWHTPYHSLLALSRVLREQPELATGGDNVDWPAVTTLLLFPHAWVRTASSRLLGTLFASMPAAPPPDDESLLSGETLEEISAKLSIQLRSDNLDDNLSIQIVKNLFYVGKCFALLEYHPDTKAADEADDDSDGEDDQEDTAVEKSRHPLSRLFSKLSYQARSSLIRRRSKARISPNWSLQPASILKWFAAMISHLDATLVERFLVHILNPVYRIVEDDTIRDPQMDDLKGLAVELQDLLQLKVGTTKFSTVYSSLRQKILDVQRDRKAVRAIQTATNPVAAAQRKLVRNVAKKESRKRKSETFL